MTKLEERLNDAACKNSPYKICACKEPDEGSCDNCKSIFDFKAGARFILELPELMALVVVLDKYGNSSEDVAVSMPFDNLDPDDFPIVEEFESGEPEDFGTKARQAVSQWRSFIGEESETL